MKLSQFLAQWQEDEASLSDEPQCTDRTSVEERRTEAQETRKMRLILADVSPAAAASICRDLPATLCDVIVPDDRDDAVRHVSQAVPDLMVCPWATWEELGDRIRRALSLRHMHRPVLVLLLQTGPGVPPGLARAANHPHEAHAIRNILHRIAEARGGDQAKALARADITLDPLTRRVTRGDRVVRLSQTTFHLLQILMAQPERVHSREELLRSLRGERIHLAIRTVDVHVKRLRKELNMSGGPDVIRTVRGGGYAFSQPAVSIC